MGKCKSWSMIFFLLLPPLITSCSYDFGNVPEGAQITCKTNADCPGSWICNTVTGFCVKEIDPTPPTFEATPKLSPGYLKSGSTATLEFTASKELLKLPEVNLVQGKTLLPFTPDESRSIGRTYVFTYTATGNETEYADYQVLVTMTDKSGNTAEGKNAGKLQFQFHAPAIDQTTLLLSGSPAKNGGMVRVSFTLNRAISTDPVVTIEGGRTFVKESSTGGISFVYSYAASTEDTPDGTQIEKALTIEATDEAGNKLSQAIEKKVVFDYVKPGLISEPAITPEYVTHLGSVTVQFISDKELGADPEVTLGGTGMAKSVQAGNTYNYTYIVSSGDTEGTKSVSIRLVDKAGNETTFNPVKPVVFDFKGPAVSGISINPSKVSAILPDFNVKFTLNKEPKEDGGIVVKASGADGVMSLTPDGGCKGSGELDYCYKGRIPDKGTAIFYSVSIEATDRAGNKVIESAGTLEADNVAPELAGFELSRDLVKVGDMITIVLSASEPLLEPPVLKATSGTDTVLFDPTPKEGEKLTYTYSNLDPAGSVGGKYTFEKLTLEDIAGNKKDFTPVKTFTVEATKPTVTFKGLKSDNSYNQDLAAGGNTVLAQFDVDRPLQGGKPSVTIAGMPMSCAETNAEKTSFECSYKVDALLDEDGIKTVTVTATDLAGNSSIKNIGAITFDFTPPDYQAGTSTVQLISDFPNNPVVAVTSVTNGTTVFATFSITEDLYTNTGDPTKNSPDPKVVACIVAENCDPTNTAHVIEMNKDTGSSGGRFYKFTKKITGLAPEASFTSNVYMIPGDTGPMFDKAGNPQNNAIKITHFDVNTAKPSAPSVGNVYYKRIPWGMKDPSNGSWIEKKFSVVCNACQLSSGKQMVLVYDSETPSSGGLIGSYTNPGTGSAWSFPEIILNGSDRAHVWLAAADSAGNISPAIEIKSAEWVATMGYKVPGSTSENPNVFTNIGMFQQKLEQELYVVEPGIFDGTDIKKVAEYGRQYWWNRTPPENITLPSSRNEHALAYDSARGKTVLFGGLLGNTIDPLNDTWEWDGTQWIQQKTIASPQARYEHALTYDSARGKTVLFGGYGSSDRLNDTWEWDGVNWTQKFPVASPSIRSEHAIAYDSKRGKTVLFGGVGSSGLLNDTWEWDGINWIQKVPIVKPPARYEHALAYDSARGKTVLFGGRVSGNPYKLNDTWEWDGVNWTKIVPVASPPARYDHSLAYDSARGKTIMFGGENNYGSPLNDTWEWDGMSWTQKVPSVSPPARYLHALSYDSERGKTVLLGGAGISVYFNDTWEWDGMNWTQKVPPSPPMKYDHALAYDSARGKTVLFGGGYSDTWEWDGVSWILKIPVTSPSGRFSPALAYDSVRGKIIMFGGKDNYNNPLNDTWEWDGVNWTQKNPVATPSARYDHALAYDSIRGKTVLYGGNGSSGLLDDTWEWDGVSWTQKNPVATPGARYDHALAYDSVRGKTVLFGGCHIWNDTWEWDGVNWTEKVPEVSPPMRANYALAYDSLHKKVVLFGGYYLGSIYLNDTWEWDGMTWTQKVPADNPPVRSSHALAYDSMRGEIVLFGGLGNSGTSLNDTWEWNGFNWTHKVLSASPPARYAHALSYDSARGKTVLFGGSRKLDDTWEWDGVSWTQKISSSRPSGRGGHTMAYDSARGETVLFGGTYGDGYGSCLDDTWGWNGFNWTQKLPMVSPPARSSYALAFDSARGKTVLFGGFYYDGSSHYLSDTWEWDGVNWAQKAPLVNPSARSSHALAYDSARGKTVLFGGRASGNPDKLNDTWEWDGVNWTKIVPVASPPVRYDHSLAYDSARGKTMLFGGYLLNDTWEWDGVNWTQEFPAASPPWRYNSPIIYDIARGEMVIFAGVGISGELNDTWEWDGQGNGKAGQVAEVAIQATGVFSETTKPQVQQIVARFFSGGSGYPWDNVNKKVNTTHGANLMAWYDNEWHPLASNTSSAAAPGLVEWTTTDPVMIDKLYFGGGMKYNFAVVPIAPNGFGDPDCVDPATNHCDMGSVSTEYMEVTVKYTLP